MGTPDWPTAESNTVQRSGVAIVLDAANTVGGLLERQAQALAEIRSEHRPHRYSNPDAPDHDCCHACTVLASPRYTPHPCETIAILEKHGV